MTVQPITPDEATTVRLQLLPDEVIQSFNELITTHMENGVSTFPQHEVVTLIERKCKISREEVFSNKYLNVEPIYRKAGWSVKYNSPGYNETGNAYFVFETPF